ncbi:verrucotoxin subunit beta-like, partial [Clarias magur]
MKQLANITYPQVFDQKTATHVVTAVLYGAQTFMVFDYTSKESGSQQPIETNFHAMVKNIPRIAVEWEASAQMTEEEKELAECVSVKFYGDIELEENPTTYKEALEVYKRLPTLMKQQQNKGVPLTVWLYPLVRFNHDAAKLVREISLSHVGKTEQLLEELGEAERTCNDLKNNLITENFPDVKDRLVKFRCLQSNYKIAFQKALSRVLLAVRSGTKEDKALEDMLNTHYSSPFTASNMNKWLDNITTELNILSSYTKGLKDFVKSPALLSSILLDPDFDVVVCLSFTSLKYADPYLAEHDFTVLAQTGERDFSCQAAQPWITSPDISERMRQNLSLFTSFLNANKNDKRMKFLIASISDPNNPGNSIRLYQKGCLTDPNFQPVSKPPSPLVVTSDDKAILTLSKSPTGKTIKFRVEYRMTPPTDSGADVDDWTVIDISDGQTNFTLTNLKPAEQYFVRYRAVSDVGVSEASDSVPISIHQKLTVKLGQAWNIATSSLLNEIRTKIMTSMGMSRWSVSTIKTEVSNVVNCPSIPYIGTIPGGLRAGMALYLQGVVGATGQEFAFNLITGLMANDDIAFHFNHRTNGTVVQNCCRNGWWKNEERISGCSLSSASAFDIFIVTKTEGYEVFVNGQSLSLFKHRLPMEEVATLQICGNVGMNVIAIIENWTSSSFGMELKSGTSRTKLSNIQFDVPRPVCNPREPYLGSIPGGLRPGVALFFQGVVPSDCESFEINFQTGPRYLHDIAFHFKPCMHSVLCNTCRNGKWDRNYTEIRGGPFVKGGAFDIIVVIKTECYEVIVNGLEYCKFNHRIPVEKVTTLDIRGDVFMKALRVIQ